MAPDHGASFFDYPSPAAAAHADRAQATDVLLPDASEADWTAILEFTHARRFGPGQSILEAGGPGGSLYLVLEGSIEVLAPGTRLGRSRRVGLLEPGSVVGEVSFFDGEPRSMGVRALTAAVLAEMSPGNFQDLFAAHPDLGRQLLMDLGRILAGRLRRAEAGASAANSGALP
jgi:CRP/FNR family transcriptional regulator, cyclic AMP receptor protein